MSESEERTRPANKAKERYLRMRRSGRLLAIATLAALGLFFVVGCGDDDDESSSSGAGGELQTVELLSPFQDSIEFLGLMVAKDRFFEDEGLVVETLPSEGSDFVVQQVISGNVDFGFGNQANVMLGAIKDSNLRGFGVIGRDGILIGVPEDSPVQTPDQLEGETFGVTDFGGGEVAIARSVFADAGILDSVELVAVGPGGPSVFAALEDGKIAGYGGFTHDIAGVEAQGIKIRNILPDNFRGLPSDGFISSQEVLGTEEGRETAVKLLRGWGKGTEFALENPEEALDIACKYAPEECTNMESAQIFEEKVLEVIQPPTEGFGIYDYGKLETLGQVVNRLPDVDTEAISALDLETIFPNEYAEEANSGS